MELFWGTVLVSQAVQDNKLWLLCSKLFQQLGKQSKFKVLHTTK